MLSCQTDIMTKRAAGARRALFVDIDGVLHPPSAIADAKPPMTPADIRRDFPATFQHEPLLAELLADHADVALVCCSSWRMFLEDNELAELFVNTRQWFAGSVGYPYRGRAFAIQHWLHRFHNIEQFAVLDDEPSYYLGSWPTLTLCDPELGLRDQKVVTRVTQWLSDTARIGSAA